MKRILLFLLCFGALNVGAQTNTFSPNEIILYTIPHADLRGNSVRITPNGWSLFGSVTANVEVWGTNNFIIDRQMVTIQNNVLRTWAAQAATNKAAATKNLALYFANKVNLTNNPTATDQPVEE